MNKEDPEPIERLEEAFQNPADKIFNSLHDKELTTKKELAEERKELTALLAQMPGSAPKKGTEEHRIYQQSQKQIQALKKQIAKNHEELMEILKAEEKFTREIQEN